MRLNKRLFPNRATSLNTKKTLKLKDTLISSFHNSNDFINYLTCHKDKRSRRQKNNRLYVIKHISEYYFYNAKVSFATSIVNMSVALILSRGIEPALTAVDNSTHFYLFRERASNVRGKQIKRGEPLAFTDTSIL
nr:MAG TPA: hypothetical protein [Microviridae sp.]